MTNAFRGAGINANTDTKRPSTPGDPGLLQAVQGLGAPASASGLPCLGERLARLFGLGDTMTLDAATRSQPAVADRAEPVALERLVRGLDDTRISLAAQIDQYGETLLNDPAHTGFGPEPFIEAWLMVQRKITASTRQQRTRIRKAVAARGPSLARLAAMDDVFDHTLAGWSSQCFSQLGDVLTRHFLALQTAASATPADAASSSDWHRQFCNDARQLLRAELEARLEPALGLLEACQPEVTKPS